MHTLSVIPYQHLKTMEKFSLLISVLMSLVSFVLSAPTPTKTYQRRVVLSGPDNYILHWSFDDTSITFETHVKTTGFTGFGLSPNGGMAGADIMVGGIRDGVPYVEDYMATGESKPSKEETQDWVSIGGSQAEGYTILKFSRLLDTCDSKDRAITKNTARIIWSYSSSQELAYHNENRGTKSIQLLGLEPGADITLPSDAVQYDFQMNNAIVRPRDTVYQCRAFRVPSSITSKQHIIKIDPIVHNGNEKFVHHILLEACQTPIDDSLHGQQYNCFEWESNPAQHCLTLIGAWAIGGESFYFPANAGLPIGDHSITFIVLQMHYDNPALTSDMIDSSGMRLWVSPSLRQYDAGILEIGALPAPSQIIPPGQKSFTTQGWCSNQCFSQPLSANQGDINIFGVLLHTHLLGTAVKLRHFRDGIEQPPIIADANYDFDFQNFNMISPAKQVKQTDDLMTECIYKSTSRNNLTLGGQGTREEMCLSFAVYYPRMSFSLCMSSPTEETIKNSLAHVAANPSQYSDVPLYGLIGTTDWSKQSNIDYFQKNINSGKMIYLCQYSQKVMQVPNIVTAYNENHDKCGASDPYTVSGLLMSLLLYALASRVII